MRSNIAATSGVGAAFPRGRVSAIGTILARGGVPRTRLTTFAARPMLRPSPHVRRADRSLRGRCPGTAQSPFPPAGTPIQMPGPDQRTVRNRRPRRRTNFGGSAGRLPVTEHEELQELEAARERNDIDVADLREMSVAELRQV